MSDAAAYTDPATAWRSFCADLAELGDLIRAPGNPAGPLDQAEGFRYLTRLLRMGLEQQLEARDPSFPFFYQLSHATAKIGADNPDNIYWNARIRGDWDYRITVRRGTMSYFSIVANAFRYHIDGTLAATGTLTDSDIEWDADGRAVLIASQHPQPVNWLRLEPDASLLVIRQSYLDRANEVPGTFAIERIGGPSAPAALDSAGLAAGLGETVGFVRGIVGTFVGWAEQFRQHPNAFPAIDQQMFQRGGGAKDLYYAHAFWRLAEDEVWVIEVTPPECDYWNFQLNNWWMESLDYRFLPVTVNKHSARYNADGSVTLVVAERDPGYGNWIATAGHREGTALLRWGGAREHPLPTTRVEIAP